ncbi:hypothetical protein AHAS_Ahas06G0150000 [Arachis hypogaea]
MFINRMILLQVQHATQCSKTECINFRVQIPLHFEALLSHPDTSHSKLKYTSFFLSLSICLLIIFQES